MFENIDTVTETEGCEILGSYLDETISLTEAAVQLSVTPKVFRDLLEEYDIEVRERSRRDIVEEAVDCFIDDRDNDGFDSEYVFSYHGNLVVQEAISEIVERINLRKDEFRVTESTLRRAVKDALWEAKIDSGNTNDVFWSQTDGIKRDLGTMDFSTFNIVFPLNLMYYDVNKPSKYEALGEEIRSFTSEDWEAICWKADQVEQKQADNSDVENDRNTLERTFETSPNDLDRPDQTYWMMEYEAVDGEYALNRCTDALEYLLGKINFALATGQLEGMQFNSEVWNTRWMDLRLPFVYFIFEDHDYSYFSYSTDPTPREPLTLSAHKADRYETHFGALPKLTGDPSDMERRLVSGISSFQDAVTSTGIEDAFLKYWQALETLTFTEPGDSTRTVVERSSVPLGTTNFLRQSEVAEKRNKLVHTADPVEVTSEDTNTLKIMLERVVRVHVDNLENWGREEFVFYYENGNKSQNALDQKEDQNLEQIKWINQIRHYTPP